MRRSVLLVLLAVVGLVMATAVPAGADAPAKTEYTTFEWMCGSDTSEARIWFSGQDDKLMHARGVVNSLVEYVLVDDVWQQVGTNTTVANVNVEAATFEGSFWGTYSLRADIIGDFDGTWSWGNSPNGRASGKGVGDDAGKIAKTTLLGAPPEGAPAPPPPPCDPLGLTFTQVVIIDPHG